PTAKGTFLSIPTNIFPEGVARFTIMDAEHRPLNERLVFVHHDNDLKINLHTDSTAYHPHDSIALHIEVKDASGQPVFGNFSVAVTDDNQVKIASNADNILSYFHLSSCLKGYVEDPFYYFQHSDSLTDAALDNLLLTQGWVGYDWKTIFSPPQKPAFEAEKTFEVKGTVVNGINKPIKNAKVSLVSQKPTLIRTMNTNQDGQFTFKDFPPIDTPRFFIQALNKRGKSFSVGINLETFTPPSLKPVNFPVDLPWNVNIDSTLSSYISDKRTELDEILKSQLAGHVLRTVEVKAKKAIPNSYNINGPGEADIVLDQSDIKKYGNISLYDFLRQHILGLNIMDTSGSLNGYDVHFIIEGMTLQYISDNIKTDPLNALTTYDIKGIEIMYSSQYVNGYDAKFANPNELIKRKSPPAYIEITTKRPGTLWEQKKAGVYVYTPVPFAWPKKFYRPRYTTKTIDPANQDLRSTIYWEPNVDMETKGQGLVTFYAADRPGGYTIILEGSDMKGHLGYSRAKIQILGKENNLNEK
ncbi:MAG TPA: carboxypeptidase regulatory-like domain-containing protein, partial [Candidatus Babeliaceae bacterium]|nr:carboxypeptidase regulatory-like domain-containing protein [Candidatus Babeliaceae bacterium]